MPVVPGRPAGGRGGAARRPEKELDRTEGGWCGSSRSGRANTPPPAAKLRNPTALAGGTCRDSGGIRTGAAGGVQPIGRAGRGGPARVR
ncbi:hypothetical protein SHO565_73900 [Streptomyces sp. HO565]